jgi:ribose transport system ATP-binding protein
MKPFLQACQIKKSFPPNVKALRGVDLEIQPGQVHCLLGANGAGKSTLLKIIAGAHQSDGGELLVNGQRRNFASPLEAARNGISMIYQELDLIPQLSVAENLFLGRVPHRFGWVRRHCRESRTNELLSLLGASFSATDRVEQLPVSGQQLTAIARALTLDARLIIMDEPSATLSETELEKVFAVIRSLVREGRSVLYVSHRIGEVMEIGTVATVIRDGVTVNVFNLKNTKQTELVEAMVGQYTSLISRPVRKSGLGSSALKVKHLQGPAGLDIRDLRVHKNQIVGLAGLSGAGRTTFLNVLFGSQPGRGEIELFGQPYFPKQPRTAIQKGLGLVPENRKTEGLVLDAEIYKNTLLPSLRGRFGAAGNRWKADATRILGDLGTRFAAINQPVRQLSGGNQQKVVLSKWLLKKTSILLLDEPSRGLDVGAKADLYRLLHELADTGMALILASSEMDELYANCDLIWVFHEGKNRVYFDPSVHSREEITHATITGRASSSSVGATSL